MTNIFSSLNLSHNPFTLATSREGFYQTESTRRILDELFHGIETRKGFMVLIGEVGVGKTSLSLQLFSVLEEKKAAFAWVFNTVFTKEELFRAIADDFGLVCERDFSLLEYQKLLHQFFLKQYESGRTCVIVVDEAHNLSNDSLESLRMLTNFESGGQKLVQVVLIGQPELGVRLSQEQLRQLRSRVAIYLTLPHLNREELLGYVNYKLAEAGSQIRLEGKAAKKLWEATGGNLRQAKLVMERVLYGCVAYGAESITPGIMTSALQEVQGAVRSAASPRRTKVGVGIVVGVGVACLVLLGLAFVPLWSVAGKGVSASDVVMGRIAPAAVADDPGTAELKRWPHLAEDVELREFGKSLKPFLGTDLYRDLQRAVALRTPEVLKQGLPQDVLLLRLDRLPAEDGSFDSWRAFAWRKYSDTGPTWLVFWRPETLLAESAPGGRSDAVFEMQERLYREGLLKDEPDGVMGTRTWYAMAAFQRKAGLPVTGAADTNTRFFLKFL